jgi:hypothetical protein
MARAPLVISGSDPVSVTLANITAYVNAGGTVTPAPVFTTQPSISPTSGTAGTTTFTATDGAASNATSYTRRWLLNGAPIGTGVTIKPSVAGSLVLEVTAHGPGGDSAPATTAAVTVSAGTGSPSIIVPRSLVTKSGNTYAFTADRTTNLSVAESIPYKLAGSTAYSPGALASDFPGNAFPTFNFIFAAGSSVGQGSVVSAIAQPE